MSVIRFHEFPVISEGKVTNKGSGSGKYTMEPDKAISEARLGLNVKETNSWPLELQSGGLPLLLGVAKQKSGDLSPRGYCMGRLLIQRPHLLKYVT